MPRIKLTDEERRERQREYDRKRRPPKGRVRLSDKERQRRAEHRLIVQRDRMRPLRADPEWRTEFNAKRRANRKPRTQQEREQHLLSERRRRSKPENKLRIRESVRRCKAKPHVKQKSRETERRRAPLDNAKSRARYAVDAEYREGFRRRFQRCYESNPAYRLRVCLRASVGGRIKRAKATKSDKTMVLVGCTLQELQDHLESQFLPGMTWENYGLKGWHVDHKIPCTAFDLTDPKQQEECFHWTNLQPLWAADNLAKTDRLPDGTSVRQRRQYSPSPSKIGQFV